MSEKPCLFCEGCKAALVSENIGYGSSFAYTYRNDVENKDVYMVALRDDDGAFIGYYEKHEYRNRETAKLYDL